MNRKDAERTFWNIWGKVTPFIVVICLVFGFTFWVYYMDTVTEYLYLAGYYDNLAGKMYEEGWDLQIVNLISSQASRYCDLYKGYRFGFLPTPWGPRDDYNLFCEAIQNRSDMMIACCNLNLEECLKPLPSGPELERIQEIGSRIMSWEGGLSSAPFYFHEEDLYAFECNEDINRR